MSLFVDASALVAILAQEPSAEPLLARIEQAPRSSMTSELAIFETVVALVRKKRIPVEVAEAEVRSLVVTMAVRVVPITAAEGTMALRAFALYGKGRGHPAQLNMGDCFAYACARGHGVPLLFVGDDFSRTDLPSGLD